MVRTGPAHGSRRDSVSQRWNHGRQRRIARLSLPQTRSVSGDLHESFALSERLDVRFRERGRGGLTHDDLRLCPPLASRIISLPTGSRGETVAASRLSVEHGQFAPLKNGTNAHGLSSPRRWLVH